MKLPDYFTSIAFDYRRQRGDLRVRYLSDAVSKLSLMFTRRAPPVRRYLEDAHLRHGYAYYFTPLNSVKTRWVLDELRGFDPDFFERPISALDYGCGCGAGMLGLLQAGVPGRVHMFDIVREVQDEARFFYDAVPNKTLEIEFVRTVRDDDRYDLILLSNVASELHDTRPALKLLDHLTDRGYLIIIEPADQANTIALQKLRDSMLPRGVSISAPCLTSAPCPMLRDDPAMWCCMEVPFDRPKFISEIDARAGFDRRSLKFSYLVVTRGGKTLGGATPKSSWRLVGDIHRSKGRACGKFCGASGALVEATLMMRDRNDASRPFMRARRGDVLAMSPDESGRVKMVEPRKPLG